MIVPWRVVFFKSSLVLGGDEYRFRKICVGDARPNCELKKMYRGL